MGSKSRRRMRVECVSNIEAVGAEAWRSVETPDFPFFDYEFLRALENSGSVGPGSGWSPVHLVCRDGERLVGALPLYLKTDSYGEYIFDWEWANAHHQHGIPYYPKLVSAVPFTPATGPKILVRSDADSVERQRVEDALFDEVRSLGEEYRTSSTHALFVPEGDLGSFEERGFAVRHSLQFHWRNGGYESFEDYLGAMEGKRRRQIARERRQLEGERLEIEHLTGKALQVQDESASELARIMHHFYLSTLDGKWGVPYLNGAFFEEVFQTMGDRILLVFARDAMTRRPIAGALNFYKGRKIFGRYWGASEERRNLHFDLCYYQAIDFAIERGLDLFEAGAQGEHKLARGFLPSVTYSAHDVQHPAFDRAIRQYISDERRMISNTVAAYSRHSPYKKT